MVARKTSQKTTPVRVTLERRGHSSTDLRARESGRSDCVSCVPSFLRTNTLPRRLPRSRVAWEAEHRLVACSNCESSHRVHECRKGNYHAWLQSPITLNHFEPQVKAREGTRTHHHVVRRKQIAGETDELRRRKQLPREGLQEHGADSNTFPAPSLSSPLSSRLSSP